MRARRIRSLRRALLLNLLVPTSVLAIALGVGGLLLINKTIERAYDRVLHGSAKAIAERISVEDGEIVVDLPQVALGMLETAPTTASTTACPMMGRLSPATRICR